MRATGIVRRIDDLGRIVVPKEIRRILKIREGDPLEIFTDSNGCIILKKYSPIGELSSIAKECAESLFQTSGHVVCVSDKEEIIAIAGGLKKEFFQKKISDELEKIINERNLLIAQRGETNFVQVLNSESKNYYNHELIMPIIAEGDVSGAVIFLSAEKKMGEVESKLAQMASIFLGKQIEA